MEDESIKTPAQPENKGRETDAVSPNESSESRRFVVAFFLGLLLIAASAAVYDHFRRSGMLATSSPPSSFGSWSGIWLTFAVPYVPVLQSLLRFEALVFGANFAGCFWIGLAFHLVNALLLWRLLALLQLPGAWLAAALFALHPMQVPTVTLFERAGDLLMLFFFFLALIAWVKFAAGKHRNEIKFYALTFVFFLLALLSDPIAGVLPIALLLISWLKRGSISRQRFLQVSPFLVLGIATAGFYFWQTFVPTDAVGILNQTLVAARSFWLGLAKIFWPLSLPILTSEPMPYLWLGAFVFLLVLIFSTRRFFGRGPEVALVFFAAALIFRNSSLANHALYLACVGPLALSAAAITAGASSLGRSRNLLLPVISAALLGALGFLTWNLPAAPNQNMSGPGATTVPQVTGADTSPSPSDPEKENEAISEEALAIQLANGDFPEQALPHFRRVVALEPQRAEAHYNLANNLAQVVRRGEAIVEYRAALRLKDDYAAAHHNLANALAQSDQLEEAGGEYRRAEELQPENATVHKNFSVTLRALGHTEEGEKELATAERLEAERR